MAPAAKTHLKRLEVVQRSAARIIYGMPRDAHAEPILKELRLPSLESRRGERVCSIADSIFRGSCHPAFKEFFAVGPDGMILIDSAPRTQFGGKRFKHSGALAYNLAKSTVKEIENDQG